VILSMISIAAMGTLAYFTDSEIAHNIITTGMADVVVEEYQLTEDGSIDTYPSEPMEIMPGETVSKIVVVRSLEQSVYVRTRYEIVIKDSSNRELPVKDGMIVIVPNTEFWSTKEDEDWFYYNAPIADGAATQPLFSEVRFDGPTITNEYQNCTVQILVYVQAVQSDHNGATALEAENWPKPQTVQK